MKSSYKFYNMGNKGLIYPVMCNKKVVIPEGTKNVKIAFGQSHLSYRDDEGNWKKMNVYLYKGQLYHA